jgi:uncharacterized delta-60 repeat protein
MNYEGDELIRLNADGSRDSTFNSGAPVGFNEISAIVVQPDGAILVAGADLRRLLPDGTLDPSFSAELSGDSTLYSRPPTRVALQPDGKIVVTGYFTAINDTPVAGIARLLPNGSLDPDFAVNASEIPGTIDAMQLQPDGKILLAGYNFTPATFTWEGRFIRLMPDGSLDPSFVTDPERGVSAIALHGDGRIVVAGYYWNGSFDQHGYINRLTENGSDDPAFSAGPFGITGWETEGVHALIVQSDGKILAGGSFFLEDYLGSLLRLNADGTRDTGFDSTFQSAGGDDIYSVTSMALQNDGRFYIAGDFAFVGGVPRQGIARLFTNGSGAQGLVSFSASSYSITESGSNFTVTIEREGPDLGPVMVDCAIQVLPDYYAYSNPGLQFGQPDEDFTATTGQVTFTNGETSKTFSLPVRNDLLIEPTETFEVAITGSSVPLAYGERTKSLLHVFDDDSLGLPGSIDPAFNGNITGTVSALFTQPDGRVLVAGAFTSFDSIDRANLLRLNLDGTLDLSFAPTVPDVTALALQQDGKIIVAGTSVSRLNADGSPDGSFQTYTLGNAVEALAIQADGKILIGNADGLQRLHTDGPPDFGFNAFGGMPAAARGSKVRALALQPDGKIFVGGENAAQLPALARLNPDGTGDPTFVPPAFEEGYYGFRLGIRSLVLQPDGKLLVGGGFAIHASQLSQASLTRLNPNGSLDAGFSSQFYSNTAVIAIIRQPDGRLLISEEFGWNDVERTQLRRLFENGGNDHSLIASTQVIGAIKAIAQQPDRHIWIGGTFQSFNGYPQPALARLVGDNQTGPGIIEFVESYGSVKENAGSVSLKLRRIWGADGPVSVHYETTDGTAKAGVHYLAASGTVSFASGEVEKTISVDLLDNSEPDFNHNFTVVLSQPMGGAQLAEFPSFWVNILENDAGILARRAEIIGNRVYERDYFSVRENIGSVLVYLFYVGDSPTSVITLNYTTHDGTARAGQDYAATTWYTLFGGPYSLTQELQVPIVADAIPEEPETFTVSLSTPTPGVEIVQSDLTITIVDNAPGFRLFAHPAGPTKPGRFRMLLQAPLGQPFTIEASTDLVTWIVLATYPAQTTADPLEFEDVDAASFSKRFYRLAPGAVP